MLAAKRAAGPLIGSWPGFAAGSGVCAIARRRPAGSVATGWGGGAFAYDAALEETAPFRTHRLRVAEKFLVERLGEAGIGRLENIRIHRLLHHRAAGWESRTRQGR